jgi:hypothetical protein
LVWFGKSESRGKDVKAKFACIQNLLITGLLLGPFLFSMGSSAFAGEGAVLFEGSPGIRVSLDGHFIGETSEDCTRILLLDVEEGQRTLKAFRKGCVSQRMELCLSESPGTELVRLPDTWRVLPRRFRRFQLGLWGPLATRPLVQWPGAKLGLGLELGLRLGEVASLSSDFLWAPREGGTARGSWYAIGLGPKFLCGSGALRLAFRPGIVLSFIHGRNDKNNYNTFTLGLSLAGGPALQLAEDLYLGLLAGLNWLVDPHIMYDLSGDRESSYSLFLGLSIFFHA